MIITSSDHENDQGAEQRNTINFYNIVFCATHPRVERKPETAPSAYREMMSPMWRKLAEPMISPMLVCVLAVYMFPMLTWIDKIYNFTLMLSFNSLK